MVKTVYIETSVISYLSAKPSRDVVAAAWQRVTAEWWEKKSTRYRLFTSEVVRAEASQGDSEAALRRNKILKGIPDLEMTDAVRELAEKLIDAGVLPKEAMSDALHVAIAAVHGVDYLLTWNCRHIDNAEMKPAIRSVCAVAGHQCAEICTPQELLGDEDD